MPADTPAKAAAKAAYNANLETLCMFLRDMQDIRIASEGTIDA
jgi:hypothetical protein